MTTFFFTMAPSFGIKYLISPMIASVWEANQSIQDLASFLFLFFYAIARFLGGAFDRYIDALFLLKILNVTAVIVHIIQGITTIWYNSDAALAGFIVCQVIIGSILGGVKILLVLLSIDIFGPMNMPNGVALLFCGAWGPASFIGPVAGWASLSGHGLKSGPNFKDDLSMAVAIYCYASAGSSAISFLTSFGITKFDFAQRASRRRSIFWKKSTDAVSDDV